MRHSKDRDRLIKAIATGLHGNASQLASVIASQAGAGEPSLSMIEDAASSRIALHSRYFSINRGTMDWRHMSVHRIVPAGRTRFIATCHRDDKLKWFRADNVLDAHLDKDEPFRVASDTVVESLHKTSLGGFHPGDRARLHTFVVRAPEARWVQRNLLLGMKAHPEGDDIRVEIETASVVQLARYVVSLGRAATAQTPELAEAVADLARGALGEDR